MGYFLVEIFIFINEAPCSCTEVQWTLYNVGIMLMLTWKCAINKVYNFSNIAYDACHIARSKICNGVRNGMLDRFSHLMAILWKTEGMLQ
jgi:hypothetical protein